jgi:uncharacterized protein YecE (DUF72 family)
MSGANLPCTPRATTDFIYLRMHGPDHHHLYSGSFPDADLTWWADRIREWDLAGNDLVVYFNNDGNANTVRNARTLRAPLVSGAVSHPATSAVNSSQRFGLRFVIETCVAEEIDRLLALGRAGQTWR